MDVIRILTLLCMFIVWEDNMSISQVRGLFSIVCFLNMNCFISLEYKETHCSF